MTVEQLAKVSSAEVYIGWEQEQMMMAQIVADAQAASLAGNCKVCNTDTACVLCIDNGLYGDDQLPPPPPYIVIPHEGYMDEEQQAYYKGEASPLQLDEAAHMLIHCEDESACRFCNPEPPVCDGTDCDCNDNVRRGPF